MMFKRYLYIIAIFSFIGVLFSCQEEKDQDFYTIKGKLANVDDSVFYAARETGDSLFIDTIKIDRKGEFFFSGQVDTLTVISLYFRNNTASPYVLVDKSWKVALEGDMHYPDLIMVEGGAINNELTKFKKENESILKERRDVARSKEIIAKENRDSITAKEPIVELKNIDFDLLNIVADYVKSNPTKISSVILIDNFFKSEEYLERLNDGLEQLKGNAADFPLTIQLKEYRDQMKRTAVDAVAPTLSQNNIKGESVTAKTTAGKYVLLTFLSTTCTTCDTILPLMIKEYEKTKNIRKELEFISVIKDVEEKPISKEDIKKIKWIVIPEYGGWGSSVFQDYNVKEVPCNILISPKGIILEKNISIYNLESKLKNYRLNP